MPNCKNIKLKTQNKLRILSGYIPNILSHFLMHSTSSISWEQDRVAVWPHANILSRVTIHGGQTVPHFPYNKSIITNYDTLLSIVEIMYSLENKNSYDKNIL